MSFEVTWRTWQTQLYGARESILKSIARANHMVQTSSDGELILQLSRKGETSICLSPGLDVSSLWTTCADQIYIRTSHSFAQKLYAWPNREESFKACSNFSCGDENSPASNNQSQRRPNTCQPVGRLTVHNNSGWNAHSKRWSGASAPRHLRHINNENANGSILNVIVSFLLNHVHFQLDTFQIKI